MKRLTLLVGLVFLLYTGNAEAVTEGELSIETNPTQIKIGLGFSGQPVDVFGRVPEGSQLYLKITSPVHKLPLDKKGKVGPLWMDVEHVKVDGIPKVYQVWTTGDIDDLPSGLKEETGISSDYGFIRASAGVYKEKDGAKESLPRELADEYIDALVKIYENQGLYTLREGVIRTGADNRFRFTIDVPANVPQQELLLSAYAVKDGKIIDTVKVHLAVRSVGIVNWVRRLAVANGPMYGTITVILALAGGLVISVFSNMMEKVFSGKTRMEAEIE